MRIDSTSYLSPYTVIYNAARDGKLQRLKNYLERQDPEVIYQLVSAVTFGCTPLIIATRNGHADIVVYLIEKCHANIEQVGSVTVDREAVEGAPALWCAAAIGNYNLVKILIEHKASVNCTTKCNSTPLRAACFGGYFNIVKYLVEHGADMEVTNKYGNTCLMIACFKDHRQIVDYLLHCGADVNKKNLKGNTPLHCSASSGNLKLMAFLLDKGAVMDKDCQGVTPLLAAALAGQKNVVDYIINFALCSREENVAALELLGATYVDREHHIDKALKCWQRAMRVRDENPASPVHKSSYKSELARYIDVTEIPLSELPFSIDAIEMRALLVRERILGPSHPDTAHYIHRRGDIYGERQNFDGCIQLWMCALDFQQKFLEPLNRTTQTTFLSFAKLFCYMFSNVLTRARVTFRDTLHIFHRAVKEIESAMLHPKKIHLLDNEDANAHFDRILCSAIQLVSVMCKMRSHLSEYELLQLKYAVYTMIKMNPPGHRGSTPLHIACDGAALSFGNHTVITSSSCEVVELLLELGACPDAFNDDFNTALHIAARHRPFSLSIFKALLHHGAHLDYRNNKRETALELAANESPLDINPLHHINLQCLCATVIRTADLPFHDRVPRHLVIFIERH